MSIVVNIGHIWELPRLSCLRRRILGMCQDAEWGVKPGRRGTPTSNWPHTRYGADRRGGVAGAEPPHKGGPNRPDRPNARREGRRVRSEKNLRSPRPASSTEKGLVVAFSASYRSAPDSGGLLLTVPRSERRIPGVDTGYSPCIITVQWDFFDGSPASSRQRSTRLSREETERSSSLLSVATPEVTKLLYQTPDRCSQAHSP